MSMLHRQWELLDPLLQRALTLTGPEQVQFVQKISTDDPALGDGLSRLLAAADAEAPWLGQGAAVGPDLLDALSHHDPTEQSQIGQRVGPFEIVREIGRGGMAQVFLARRADGLFDQQVALKMMWQGLLRGDLLSRFERERQILANLNDPHIASLLDGGVTDSGRPWLAMEYIDGQPITDYCQDKNLDQNPRLELLLAVSGAVASAHRREVIHRDIKPSNVLVDRSGKVRLVDFGIAKLLGDGPQDQTVTEARLLTPEYASPEQIEGLPADRRSDVYQLGLLAFELLTGRRPFVREGASPLTFQRLVVETPAPRPSRVAAGNIRGRVDRDLDAIVLKCLEKNPADRYSSVEELAQDLRNYQLGLPLLASSGRRWHRARRFVVRHRLGVAVSGLFGLLLLAYAGTVTWQSSRIAAERDAARMESRKASEVAAFMQELFANASPAVSLGKKLSIKDMVDQGSIKLDNQLNNQPELKAAMLDNLAGIYHSLGEYPAAINHLQRSLTLKEENAATSEAELASTLTALGSAQRGAGDFEAALKSLNRAAAIQLASQSLDQRQQLALARVYSELGITHSELRNDKRSGDFHLKALEIRRQQLPADSIALAMSKADYGVVLHKQARRDEAGELYRQAAQVQETQLGPAHPRTLTTLRNLAVLEIGLNNLEQADRLLRQVLDRELTIYEGDHPKMAWTLGYLGRVARDRQRMKEAEGHWREAVRVLNNTLPEGHMHAASASHELAKILLALGKVDEACQRIEATLALRLSQQGDASISTNQSRFHLGRCRAAQGELASAKKLMTVARPHLAGTEDEALLLAALSELENP